MQSKKKILICPLDWGIGHATRCVPLINKLRARNFEVLVAAGGRTLAYLENEFPDIKYIQFRGYSVKYPQKGNMMLKMMVSAPRILNNIYEENLDLQKIIKAYKISAVISDNRFGCWSKQVPSIYISHQISVKAPAGFRFLEGFLFRLHSRFINKYDQCWIPDYKNTPNLSGGLSHLKTPKINHFFIGPLSRFNENLRPAKSTFSHELLAIVSGPEPQRSIFENILIEQLNSLPLKALILSGKPEENTDRQIQKNIRICSNLPTTDLAQAINQAEIVVCRPGYSTLMDLAAFGKKALLVPTPGQTEQEYLANFHAAQKRFYVAKQSGLNLKDDLSKALSYQGFRLHYDTAGLETALDSFQLLIEKQS